MKHIRLFENFNENAVTAAVAAGLASDSGTGSYKSDIKWKVEPCKLSTDKNDFKNKSGIVLLQVHDTEKVLAQFFEEWEKNMHGKASDFDDYQDDMKLAYWNTDSKTKGGTFFKPDDKHDVIVPFSKKFTEGADEGTQKKIEDWMSKWSIKDKDSDVKGQGLSEYINK